MRKLHELYRFLRAEYSYQATQRENRSEGICTILVNMFSGYKIDDEEYDRLLQHLNSNKPSIDVNPEFFYASNYTGDNYWWDCKKRDESNESRIKFLDKMVDKTFNDYVLTLKLEEAEKFKAGLPPRDELKKLSEMYRMTYNMYLTRKGNRNNKQRYFSEGICDVMLAVHHHGLISEIDYIRLSFHFRENKPRHNLHEEFATERHFTGGLFWWQNDPKRESDKSRMAFLRKMIVITEKDEEQEEKEKQSLILKNKQDEKP